MPNFLQEKVRDAIDKIKKAKASSIGGITTKLRGGATVVKLSNTYMPTPVTKIEQEKEIPKNWAKSIILKMVFYLYKDIFTCWSNNLIDVTVQIIDCAAIHLY